MPTARAPRPRRAAWHPCPPPAPWPAVRPGPARTPARAGPPCERPAPPPVARRTDSVVPAVLGSWFPAFRQLPVLAAVRFGGLRPRTVRAGRLRPGAVGARRPGQRGLVPALLAARAVAGG